MEILKPYRARIDELDDKIVDLLIEREKIIREVAEIKFAHNISAVLPDRVKEVRERNALRAAKNGSSEDLLRELYTRIIKYSCDLEENLMQEMRANPKRNASK